MKTDIKVKPKLETIHLFPAFDEFMVSYRDRSASLFTDFTKNIITRKYVFKPIIVVNGRVLGVWKRTFKKNKVIIEPSFFDAADALTIDTLAASALGCHRFWGMPTEI